MKILFDHQMFSIQEYGGITKYFVELIKNIPPSHEWKLSLLFSDNHFINEHKTDFISKNFLPDRNFIGKYYIKKKIYSVNQLYSKHCLTSRKFDLFHPTFYDTYFLDIIKTPYVITVHDLIYFLYKDTFYKDNSMAQNVRYQMEKVIKNANRIIAISEKTKNDLVEILNIPHDSIDVIYHGYNTDIEFNTPCNIFDSSYTSKNYILYVGDRHTYKNFIFFIKSIKPLLQKEKGLHIICVGPPFNKEEIHLLNFLKIEKQVTTLRVNNIELNNLYANALTFVYPSLYEGFGMPILEAFANNCPVCLSYTSCFPEIAGNAAVYFDPLDSMSILTQVENVIYDTDLAKNLIKLGKDRLSNFSWKKTAIETTNTYNIAI